MFRLSRFIFLVGPEDLRASKHVAQR